MTDDNKPFLFVVVNVKFVFRTNFTFFEPHVVNRKVLSSFCFNHPSRILSLVCNDHYSLMKQSERLEGFVFV